MIYSSEDTVGNVTILWGGVPYFSFNRNDLFSTFLGIAQLDSIHVLHKTICEIFKVSRNTITNVSNIYREEGTAGLLNYHHGAPGVEKEVKSFVIQMYLELDKCRGYQRRILEAVEERAEAGEFKKCISRTTLHNILAEYEEQREEQKRKNIEDRKAGKEPKDKKKKLDVMAKEEETTGGSDGDEQLEFGEDLAEGEERCVEHGGCTLVVPLLGEHGLAAHIPADQNGARFTNTELAMTYAILNAGEVAEVEQDFKLLPRYEMGGMIGRNKLPSLSLYRNRIPQMVDRMDMREVILDTSKRMRELLCFSDVLYIDGHFMVYHGRSETLHGYNPQKLLRPIERDPTAPVDVA